MFLLTDAQVPDEKFLVVINDLLASGEIPELFADDELENVINGIRNEVKGAGLQDTKENCWSFFIDRVRRQLKVSLCRQITTMSITTNLMLSRLFCVSLLWVLLSECVPASSQRLSTVLVLIGSTSGLRRLCAPSPIDSFSKLNLNYSL